MSPIGNATEDRIRDSRGELIPPKGGSSTAPAIPVIPDWYICKICGFANEWNAGSDFSFNGKSCLCCGSDYIRKARFGKDEKVIADTVRERSGADASQDRKIGVNLINSNPGLIDLGNGIAVNPANVSMVQLVAPQDFALKSGIQESSKWGMFVLIGNSKHWFVFGNESDARAAYAKLTKPQPRPACPCKYQWGYDIDGQCVWYGAETYDELVKIMEYERHSNKRQTHDTQR